MLFAYSALSMRVTFTFAFVFFLMSFLNGASSDSIFAEDAASEKDLASRYEREIAPIVKHYCFECHSEKTSEAEISFESMPSITEVRKHTKVWLKVASAVDSQQMPPKDAKPLPEVQRATLQRWMKEFLTREAEATAGDPGPVVLRRLNNAEYTYTLRDLTGIPTLDPAREFPADSAAGEGFTNTGAALVMSPSLVTKYLDAAKEVSKHLVLLPDRIRFSEHTTRSDWTNDSLASIRGFYNRYCDTGGGDTVNLQGIIFDTNQGGRLPMEKYLGALLESKTSLANGSMTIAKLAEERKLNEKYLGGLWSMLTSQEKTKPLMDRLRQKFRDATPNQSSEVLTEIGKWQKALWRFSSVGHIGKVNGPKSWQEPTDPIQNRQEIRLKLPSDRNEIKLYLTVGDAGDGSEEDLVMIERPRLAMAGRPDLLLRDLQPLLVQLNAHRARMLGKVAACLEAAAEAQVTTGVVSLEELAKKHQASPDSLQAWFDYLGIGVSGNVQLGALIPRRMEKHPDYEFIRGWVGDDALSVTANSSDQHVRIPGNMAPHSIAVHPSPTQSVAIGWLSPKAMELDIDGTVKHAHPECGNGVAWSVELRRGNTRQKLASGFAQGDNMYTFGPFKKVAVLPGDVVSLIISPRDGNHSCDLTAVDMTLKASDTGSEVGSLSKDLSPDILAGNPHADRSGENKPWHFYSEPASGSNGYVIPTGSLLATWQSTKDPSERSSIAKKIESLLQKGGEGLDPNSPDRALYQQLTSIGGPLMAAALRDIASNPDRLIPKENSSDEVKQVAPFGIAPGLFGKHPQGGGVEPASLCLQAPGMLEFTLPGELAAGAEFVFASYLDPTAGKEGSVQIHLSTEKPSDPSGLQASDVQLTNANGPWTSNNRGVLHTSPVICNEGSRKRLELTQGFEEFRRWFPIALCYTKIVPVDEVVTLTLFYREDDQLQRLMLDDASKAELDRMWNELHYSARDALTLVDAFEQLWQYATQDADPSAFEPLREPIQKRAAEFRNLLESTEGVHVESVLRFAETAYRRPLLDSELQELRNLYANLRRQELPHEDSVRLMLARALIAPAFLYRIERPSQGTASSAVTDWELASRLSYFLWSSAPDQELRELARQGKLHEPQVLRSQAQRMLKDPKVRRLGTEFACQWLHIYEFDTHDEKSESHFPTFAALRSDMYEESIRFFADLFQSDRPFLSLFNADYTYLNESLAQHYQIPGVTGGDWRRVDGVKQFHRGGILTLASTLSKQAGASRTSPILRGNWLSEVVLGEKLPKPPKNVPPLAETAPSGMTERQMIERHSIDEACSKCHARIDPLGFSLEGFDAIGRFREKDVAGLEIDTKTRFPDGTDIAGLEDLRSYLTTVRRESVAKQFNRKLLGYALGRSVQLSDEPLLAEMMKAALDEKSGMQSLVDVIIQSHQFREIRGRDAAFED